MRNKKSSNVRSFALGGVLAATAGFLAGLLTAPKSGKEIRGDIKQAGDSVRTDAEKELKTLNIELNKAIKEAKLKSQDFGRKTKKDVDNLVVKADETNVKVREILSALHEGDATDQDLKRAVKNAKSALEHLKDYLNK
ncbi:MAG TPA: YtxH domain-containing protein [Candidatus Saccharimonadales bacterium]|nr:YtxH domain-containing protein [Candidatus Saccharimonadales bacterium]